MAIFTTRNKEILKQSYSLKSLQATYTLPPNASTSDVFLYLKVTFLLNPGDKFSYCLSEDVLSVVFLLL